MAWAQRQSEDIGCEDEGELKRRRYGGKRREVCLERGEMRCEKGEGYGERRRRHAVLSEAVDVGAKKYTTSELEKQHPTAFAENSNTTRERRDSQKPRHLAVTN